METPIISEIEIVPIRPKFGLIAFASFVLFDALFIGGVGIHTRPHGGIRLVYPRKKNVDLCHPVKHELGLLIEDAVRDVLVEYEII